MFGSGILCLVEDSEAAQKAKPAPAKKVLGCGAPDISPLTLALLQQFSVENRFVSH